MQRLIMMTLPALALAACDTARAPAPDDAMLGNDVVGTMDTDMMANSMATAAMDNPTDAPSYLARAGASDLFEIESSRAVLAKAQDADIRKFAQQMIDQHTASTDKIKAAAQEAGMTVPPPTLTPDQQKMLDEIEAASAENVAAVYLADQRAAHDAALALHRTYAERGDAPALKKAASEVASVVAEHIEMLENMPQM